LKAAYSRGFTLHEHNLETLAETTHYDLFRYSRSEGHSLS